VAEPPATIGGAEEDWELVADEFAAAAGEDRRTAGGTSVLPLAALGREPSDATAVWSYAAKGRGATGLGHYDGVVCFPPAPNS
jgi:hypothetical protein